MKRFTMIAKIVALVCVTLVFSVSQIAYSITETKQIGESENAQTVPVARGTILVIRLQGNITTGYSWGVTSVSGQSLIQLGKVDYVSDPGMGVGRGGTFTVRFQAAESGAATIKMEYARPWEHGKPAVKTFTVNVKVAK